ncbi:MAG TPA: sugar transferase [Anaerolineales bacterium]|nr:sugar transferase [Anaerolineales bacterium]
MRRAVDLLVAIFCLTIFGPLILLIAVLIQLDSPEAILYMPQMVGQHGKVFSLFRFRTMSVDLLNAEQRLTPIGKFIRNYSLDHLPMLINLLIGDLTLVGPRPMELEVVDFQDKSWQHYFSVKPGLFNYAVLKLGKLWTLTRISHPALNQELELQYLQNRSTIHDLRLIVKFIWGLITSKGNIKARGAADPEMERQVKGRQD